MMKEENPHATEANSAVYHFIFMQRHMMKKPVIMAKRMLAGMGVRACRPCRSIPAGRWPDMRGLSGNWAYPRTGSWSSVWSRPWPPGKPFLPDRWLFPEECRAAEARSPPRCRGRKEKGHYREERGGQCTVYPGLIRLCLHFGIVILFGVVRIVGERMSGHYLRNRCAKTLDVYVYLSVHALLERDESLRLGHSGECAGCGR